MIGSLNGPGHGLFWLVKRTLVRKNYMPKNFLEINRYFPSTSYCNTIGQSNNAFSIKGFFHRKTKSPCFDIFIHWLIEQITNTYRNHFSRSYEIRSKVDPSHGTRHLCTRLRTDGIKAISRGFTGGQTNLGRFCLFLDNRK